MPDRSGQGLQNLLDRIERMRGLGPEFIDITWCGPAAAAAPAASHQPGRQPYNSSSHTVSHHESHVPSPHPQTTSSKTSSPQRTSSRSSPPVPKTIKLRAHALLSLPYRLTHPPPPQPKTSAWGITPHFRIPLDEILDRKHLPPLGLKDFEEWLLFIDRTPECL